MKLHIGGRQRKDGWTILNAVNADDVDIVADITDLSSLQRNSCDEIYASHVLEHVPQASVEQTLSGIARILKRDGKFYCSVPDLETLSRLMTHEKLGFADKFLVMRMIYGGQIDEYDYHYTGFTFEILCAFAKQAGFKKITRVDEFGLFDDTSSHAPFGIPISLNVVFEK